MSGWIIRWLLNIVALKVIVWLLPNFSLTLWGAIVGCTFLGFVNAWIRPALLLISFRPQFNWLLLAAVTLVINCLGFGLTAATIKGFDMAGLGTVVLAILLASIFSIVISFIVRNNFYGTMKK